jgi:hypothetical protein
MTVSRADEVSSIQPDRQMSWLAAQIDDVEARVLEAQRDLAVQILDLTRELRDTREGMQRNTSRIVWTVLTASITLLVSVVGIVVTSLIGRV